MPEPQEFMELRIYKIKEGMRDLFDQRAREVTFPLFARLGFRCERFWADTADPHTVYYMLRWNSRVEMDRKRAEFSADPRWQEMLNADGFVSVMDGAQSILLQPIVESTRP